MFLNIVADKTGYPKEILNLEMNMESDLGIDSIKRVEIFSAIKDEHSDLPEVDPEIMSTIHTLKDVIDYLQGSSIELKADGLTYADSITSDEETALKKSQIGRYVLKPILAPHSGFSMPGLIEAKRISVFDDETGVANALIQKLKDSEINAEVVKEVPDDCDALIYLGGLRNISKRQDAIDVNREAFAAAKKMANRLSESNGLFVTVQNTGGDFGLSGKSGDRAWLGGLSGLVKTASIEWPKASLKAIDIDSGLKSAKEIAEAIGLELLNGGPETEVGLKIDGSRYRLKSYEKPNNSSHSNTISKDSIVVVSGGARGVTAKALIQLAQKAKPRLVLLGRTELEDEPDFCQSAASDAEIKSALLAEANARGRKVSPMELGNRSKKILAIREIKANLEAMRRAGSQVRYVSVDVLNESRLKSELQRIREQWGPITGLVHAAGVLADKRIAEKTMDQFDLVFNTKVRGLESLLAATAQDPLKTICLFSSIAGRTGNMGQSDYAMANEVLNKVAGAESFQRKGDCLVKSLNWGPWDGGMVSDLLKDYFEDKGIPLIPVDIGSQYFVEEIISGTSEHVEVVVGPKPPDGVLSISPIEKVINLSLHVNKEKYPFIDSHRIKDVPVVPMVLVLEWFIKAAGLHSPDFDHIVCKNLKVLRGITLNNYTAGSEHLMISCRQVSNGDMPIRLALTLPAPNGGSFYSAEVEMSLNDQVRKKVMRSKKNGLPSWKWDVSEIYKEKLFHGPKFQVIRSLEGVSEEKATCILNGTNEMQWPDAPWQNDVAALDGGLQLAVLWCKYNINATSLPTAIGTYHRYQNGPISGPIYCELNGKILKNDRTLSDISFFNNEGMLAAKLYDVELHAYAS
jgi:NAD(P)-dependent dehydrogenase (short-subunit alcohol dehydrogenase family)/acyl carrier protein